MVKNIYTEDEVKRAMNIDSFRNLSKHKVMEFVSLLPQVDRDVAISIINQFPNYALAASEMVQQLKNACDSISESNDTSMLAVTSAYNTILDALAEQLKKENLSPEEREAISGKMIEVADKLAEKDTENKHFLLSIGQCIASVVFGAMFCLAAVLGVRYKNSALPHINQ